MTSKGGFAARHGAIGSAGGMAVFPTEGSGRQALIDLLKSSNYNTLKITDLPEKNVQVSCSTLMCIFNNWV